MLKPEWRIGGRSLVLALGLLLLSRAAGAGGPWLDAGASKWPAPEGAGPGAEVSFGGWMDVGAGQGANRQAVEAARWAAWKVGALMAAEWRSEKLSDSPDLPFDTWLLVFSRGEKGIESIGEYTRGVEPPSPLALYELLRGQDLVILSRREFGSRDFAQPFATLRREGSAWLAATATSSSSYSLLPNGTLAIDRQIYGTDLEERYAPGGTATFSRGGVLTRRGSFAAQPDYGVAQWTERPVEGVDDIETDYWFDSVRDDSLKFSVGTAEPIAEASFQGTGALTSGPQGLEGLAIADTILGSSRRATPVLAWAFLGRLAQGGAD